MRSISLMPDISKVLSLARRTLVKLLALKHLLDSLQEVRWNNAPESKVQASTGFSTKHTSESSLSFLVMLTKLSNLFHIELCVGSGSVHFHGNSNNTFLSDFSSVLAFRPFIPTFNNELGVYHEYLPDYFLCTSSPIIKSHTSLNVNLVSPRGPLTVVTFHHNCWVFEGKRKNAWTSSSNLMFTDMKCDNKLLKSLTWATTLHPSAIFILTRCQIKYTLFDIYEFS